MSDEKRISITGHVEASEASGSTLTGVTIGSIGARVAALEDAQARSHEALIARLGGAVQAEALAEQLRVLTARVAALERLFSELHSDVGYVAGQTLLHQQAVDDLKKAVAALRQP
jgi:hypothetical protein